jgi:hypothetical protein
MRFSFRLEWVALKIKSPLKTKFWFPRGLPCPLLIEFLSGIPVPDQNPISLPKTSMPSEQPKYNVAFLLCQVFLEAVFFENLFAVQENSAAVGLSARGGSASG